MSLPGIITEQAHFNDNIPHPPPDQAPIEPQAHFNWLIYRFTQVESQPPLDTQLLNSRSICADADALGSVSCRHTINPKPQRIFL